MERPDLSTVVAAEQIEGEDAEETKELLGMRDEARAFISSFQWCGGVKEMYFGFGIGGVVAVFLVRIEARRTDVDEWLWIVVGDLPPAYLVTDDAPNPACALAGYVTEMSRWVSAVRIGRPTDELIPVNVPASNEYAEMLDSRLKFLVESILKADHAEALKACNHGRDILSGV